MTRARAGKLMLAAAMLLSQPLAARAADSKIAWEADLATAQARAGEQKKLVLQFFLIGNLGAPDC